MFIVYAIVAIVLAVALAGSAMAKLTSQPRVVEGIGGLGVPLSWFPALAAAELAGAIGLIIGLWVPLLGIAAAIGIVLYFIGAVAAHLRANDRGFPAPALLGVLGAVALVARLVSQ